MANWTYRGLWVLMIVLSVYIVACAPETYWTCSMAVEINGIRHSGTAEGDDQETTERRAYEIACNKFSSLSAEQKRACAQQRLRATRMQYSGECKIKIQLRKIF